MNDRQNGEIDTLPSHNYVDYPIVSQASSQRPQVLSFFCGAGGLDLGFTQAGYDVVLAADFDQASVDTHNANADTPIAQKMDLRDATVPNIVELLRALPFGTSPIGIIGGPPCQGFSRANTKRSATDPRNGLASRYAALIIELANVFPIQFFVFENVPGLLAEQNSSIVRDLKQTLSATFNVSINILNAVDFGVPQIRRRVFMVGIRKTKKTNQNVFKFPVPEKAQQRTVRDAIDGLPNPKFFERSLTARDIPHHPNHWTMRPKSTRFGPDLISSGRSLIRLEWDKPSRTVAYGHREIHVHPSGERRLSIYEAMLLQGFPPTYQLSGNLSEQVTQVSNAVPPPVAKALAMKLLSHITPTLTQPNND